MKSIGKERKGIPSEQTAHTRRLIDLLIELNVSPELWRGIIKGAKEAGVLGSPDIPNCIESAKRGRLGK